jgi:hypothetical protein
LVFEKNANFVAENGPKSQKIVIITLTPAHMSATKKSTQNDANFASHFDAVINNARLFMYSWQSRVAKGGS